MIVVKIKNAPTHIKAIQKAIDDGEVPTWSSRPREFTDQQTKTKSTLMTVFHDTSSDQWTEKGEFLLQIVSDDSFRAKFYIPEGQPNLDPNAYHALHGRLVEMLAGYGYESDDFQSIELTINRDWLKKMAVKAVKK